MPHHFRLIRELADGRFHSGEVLGAGAGLGRAAIWKQLQGLESLGLKVQAVRGRGYRLSRPLELLDVSLIESGLSEDTRRGIPCLYRHDQIDSTSNYLRERLREGAQSGTVCVAEYQTAGRGRRGRQWVSPYGCNLYFSMLWQFDGGPAALGGLSLAVGIAVLKTIKQAGVAQVGLKWPNDIYSKGAKLGGVLVEISGEATGPCFAIIGIGINVDMPEELAIGVDQPWTNLSRLVHGRVSRNGLAAALLNELVASAREYEQGGVGAFIEDWKRHDILLGKPVELHFPREIIRGHAGGIDGDGALLVDVQGEMRRFTSGEVSLRPLS